MEENRRRLESAFHIPPNADMVLRPFAIGTRPPLRAVAAYMQGLAKRDIINHAILTSMMQLAHLDPMPLDRRQFMGEIACRWLPGDEVKPLATWPQVIDEIVFGATVVLVEGSGRALSVDAQGRPVPP
ncbi:MAG TPA: hypothetical protein DCM14_08380 [Clostridiales bacterium UBA8153]|nr:hypothetical protein [Clostridiales bacterium UBA8153]